MEVINGLKSEIVSFRVQYREFAPQDGFTFLVI